MGKGRSGDVVGDHGLGERNERGDRLVQFCQEQEMWIANTHFQKPERKLYTWRSPGDVYRNQIDFLLINKRFKNCVSNQRQMVTRVHVFSFQILKSNIELFFICLLSSIIAG